MVLFIAMVLLTWYGKQGSNNPFTPLQRVLVIGHQGHASLFIQRTSGKKKHLLAIMDDSSALFPDSILKIPQQWDLISPSTDIDTTGLHPPPRTWMVFDTSKKTAPINHWPVPQPFKQQTFENYRTAEVFPFNDERSALQITFKKSSVLLIDGAAAGCSAADTTYLKEKIDLLVITNTDSATTTLCRSLFRPKFTVASGHRDLSMPSYANLLLFTSGALQYVTFRMENGLKQLPAPAR
jgi:hypothetical protein